MAYYLFIFTFYEGGEKCYESYCVEASCLFTAHKYYTDYIKDFYDISLKKVIVERIR